MKSTAKDETRPIPRQPPSLQPDVSELITEDDTPVDNLFSEKQQRLLTEPLYSSWTGGVNAPGEPTAKRRFLAAANVGLFPSVHQPPLVPDVFLSLDVEVAEDWYDKRHRSYFFWEFGKAPEVVIEIVSNRQGNELGSKLGDYARMGVAYYVVYDPAGELSEVPLQIYELHAGRYKPRSEGTLAGVGLGVMLWEGVYEDKPAVWLRWYDENGVLIPTGAERAALEAENAARERDRAALEAENAARERARATREAERAEREAERATREAERAERLASKLRALGVDPDHT